MPPVSLRSRGTKRANAHSLNSLLEKRYDSWLMCKCGGVARHLRVLPAILSVLPAPHNNGAIAVDE